MYFGYSFANFQNVNDFYSYFEKGCRKTVHATSRKVIWDMINTLVPDTVAVEPTFVGFL